MSKSIRNFSRCTAATAAVSVITLCASVTASFAADLSGTISCVQGDVAAYDYAELTQNFAETTWDRRSTLRLRSDTAALTLEVIDINGQSVCEEVAELRTSCTWNLTAGGTYTVKIDNTNRPTESGYRLCAN